MLLTAHCLEGSVYFQMRVRREVMIFGDRGWRLGFLCEGSGGDEESVGWRLHQGFLASDRCRAPTLMTPPIWQRVPTEQ